MRLRIAIIAAAPTALAGTAIFADDRNIDRMSEYVIESLPVVTQFEQALAQGDQSRISELTTEDFQVIDRSDYDNELKLEALLNYLDGCEPAGRMSANAASISITHECRNYEYRYVLYNVRDERVRRIIIGEVAPLTIQRDN